MDTNEKVVVLGNQDFYASAYLIASGFPLISNFKDRGITTFNFEQSDKILDALGDYYSMQSMIKTTDYVSAIKSLKALIHANTNQNKKPLTMNETQQWNR
jgi:hypothetical protein